MKVCNIQGKNTLFQNPSSSSVFRVIPETSFQLILIEKQAKKSPTTSFSKEASLSMQFDKIAIGGLTKELEIINTLINMSLQNPQLCKTLGVKPPKGILLYGPPGTGKTLLVKYVCNYLNIHLIPVSGPELLNPYYGASETLVIKLR